VTFDKTEYHIDTQIKKLEQELNPDVFRRVNRQMVINVNSIHRIEPYFNGKLSVKVIPDFSDKIVVSKVNARSFMEWVDQ
jgi:two-component system, LytTR family, response regulator LytT